MTPSTIRLTPKGELAAQPDKALLRAPCIDCGVTVYVRRSGVYGRYGIRHRRTHQCAEAAAA